MSNLTAQSPIQAASGWGDLKGGEGEEERGSLSRRASFREEACFSLCCKEFHSCRASLQFQGMTVSTSDGEKSDGGSLSGGEEKKMR